MNGSWVRLGVMLAVAGAGACAVERQVEVPEDAASDLAEVYCTEYFRCGCEGFVAKYGGHEACQADFEARLQLVLDEGEARGLQFDRACMDRAKPSIESYDCGASSSFTAAEQAAMGTGCVLFHGNEKANEPCERLDLGGGSECRKDLRCNGTVCVAPIDIVAEGSACGFGANCDSGHACLDDVCTVSPAEGEACANANGGAPDNYCALGLHCEDASSTCQPRAPAGAVCEPHGCVAGYVCNESCVPQAPIVCGI